MYCLRGVIGRAKKAIFPLLFVPILFLVNAPLVYAVPASPLSVQEVQPDGTVVTLRVRGDEHFNWMHDPQGFTVVRNGRWLEYARLNSQGRLVPSGLKVGLSNPAGRGLSPGILPTAAARAASAKVSSGGSVSVAAAAQPFGEIRNLVVLVQFSNHQGRGLPSTSELDVLFNAPGGDPELAPTGSIRDLYLLNSYGQLELNSDIAPWVTVSGTEQYYANGASGDSTLWNALREALDELDRSIDFSQYDANGDGYIDSITFLHSGYGAEWGGMDADGTPYEDRIWSHRWAIQNPSWTSAEGVTVSDYHISPALWGTSGSSIGRIGVIAHETGHFLGLPDLYDTDGGGEGIGSFGLMGNAWGFKGDQLCPPHLSPWSKIQLGWVRPTVLAQPGTYTISQSATNDDYFVVSSGYASGEYLLIENRQRAGFDCSLALGGLAIWHIDDEADFDTEGYPDRRWPENGKHYRVALAQADGNFQLEKGYNRGDHGDLHRAQGVDAIAPGPDGHPNTDGYQRGRITVTGHVIHDISGPGEVMSFCFNGCGDGGASPATSAYEAPSDLSASLQTAGKGKNVVTTVNLRWMDNSNGDDNEDLFIIERCEETGKGKDKSCVFAPHVTVGQDVNSFSESPGSGTFMYRVKARRGASDDTAYSNEVEI